jgi:hypothetical protein
MKLACRMKLLVQRRNRTDQHRDACFRVPFNAQKDWRGHRPPHAGGP